MTVDDGSGTPTSRRIVTQTGYNTFGEVTHTKDENGQVTTKAYDRLGRNTLTTQPSYTTPAGATISGTESRSYDAVGNLIGLVDQRGSAFEFVYNSRDWQVAAYDPQLAGQPTRGVTRTFYDDLGVLPRDVG